eukprot:620617-Amphidinium_carterae.1
MVEVIVYVPACIWLYVAYHHRRAERDALELVVCVMQAYGTVVYFAPEVLSGMPSASVDTDWSFTPYYLKYFWPPFYYGVIVCQALVIALTFHMALKNAMRDV